MTTQTDDQGQRFTLPGWLLALLPLLLLGALVWGFLALDPMASITGTVPPVETLTIERIELLPDGMVVHAVNGGPEPVTVAQVLVDDAYWSYEISPGKVLGRLGRATITIPYPWVEGETHAIRLITNTGATFDAEVAVAVETPQAGKGFWLIYAVVGFYVGIVPIGLGLLWFPLLRRMGRSGMNFILALTVGLLVFLLLDTLLEAIEIGSEVPGVFQAVPLIFLVAALSFLALMAITQARGVTDRNTYQGRVWLATMIALGIGLHNLGEGMAIGAAFAQGAVSLGTFLVVGFTIHNITEGIGIGAPIARDRPSIYRFLGLLALAGGPAILGTWIGGFAFNPLAAVLFLSIGVGAILQVVYEVTRIILADSQRANLAWANRATLGGLVVGIAFMYFTAFLVKF